MPNRILRDWTDSLKIDLLDVNTERFFTRLIMKVDDYGRFYSDTRLLKANLFPLKTDIRETDISRWIAECEKSGLIVTYNVANRGYLQITDFKQQLRQKKEKYPSPNIGTSDDSGMHSRCVADDILKRNESETKGRESPAPDFQDDKPDLSKSNLFRQPKIPSKSEVWEVFSRSGGTKDMAKAFYEKHESTGWFLSGSPITNFVPLANKFISNWRKNEKGNSQFDPSIPMHKRGMVR